MDRGNRRPQLIRGAAVITMDRQGDLPQGDILVDGDVIEAIAPTLAALADAEVFDAAGCIVLASESAVKVAGEAIQALGGAGYTKDWPVERYWRDAKLLDIGAGTNEVRRMLIGRDLIGPNAASGE